MHKGVSSFGYKIFPSSSATFSYRGKDFQREAVKILDVVQNFSILFFASQNTLKLLDQTSKQFLGSHHLFQWRTFSFADGENLSVKSKRERGASSIETLLDELQYMDLRVSYDRDLKDLKSSEC